MIDELEKLASESTPGPWDSAYHNRTETWALTNRLDDCDPINDWDNVIAIAPNGSSEWSLIFEYIAAANPETIKKLIRVVRAAQRIGCPKWGQSCVMVGVDELRAALKDLEGE